MTVFLAESRERSSKDGMSYLSLADNKKVKALRTLFYPRQEQNCTPLRNVLVHASFSMDYGWICLVKLQKKPHED